MVLIESIRIEDLIAAGRVVRNCLFVYLRGAWKPEERMARMVLVNSASPFFYQLDAGVGLNRPNNKGDVGLVQFFLEMSRWKWGGDKTVTMDGMCGRGTIDAILAFQQAVNRQYNIPFVKTDSAVDPIKTLPIYENSPSTLGQLHIYFWQTNAGSWPHIHKSGKFNAAVVPELFRL